MSCYTLIDLLVQSYLIKIPFLWFTSNPRKPSQWSLGESWLHRTNTTLKHFNNQFLIKCIRLCSPIPTEVVYSFPSFLLCLPWPSGCNCLLSSWLSPMRGSGSFGALTLVPSSMASGMWPRDSESSQWWVKQPKGSCLGGRSGTLVAQISS